MGTVLIYSEDKEKSPWITCFAFAPPEFLSRDNSKAPLSSHFLLDLGPGSTHGSTYPSSTFSLSGMKFSSGPEEGNCEGKAEGWWRFALIVGSPASLLFFCNSFPHSEDESIMSDLLCQRRNHLQVFSTSCWPHLARISPTLAFTWLRLTYRSCFLKVWNNSRDIVIVQRYIHICPGDVWPGRHLRGIPSTIGWTCRHLWGRKRGSVSCAFAFSGQLWQGLLWLLEWRLSDIRYPGPLLPVAAHLLGKCTNNTHPGLFLLVDYGSLG